MSKRNYKAAMGARRPADMKRPAGARRPVQVKGRPEGKPNKGRVKAGERPREEAPKAARSTLPVRVAAIAVAVLAVAGGVSWAISANPNFTPWIILGLVALGVLAGLMVFVAIRAADIASQAGPLLRRSRE